MKKYLSILIAIIITGAGFFYWYSTTQASIGSLNIYNGDVDILRKNQTQNGQNGTNIKPGDVLKVHSNSRVSIILKDGSVVRLEAGSVVDVSQLNFKNGNIKNAVLEVKGGKLWTHLQPLQSGSSYVVETPTVVAAVRGTSFNVGYAEATSKIFVYRHNVNVNLKQDLNSSKQVSEGQLFKITDANTKSDYQAGPTVSDTTFIDDWIIFNEKEDNKLDSVPDTSVDSQAETATTTPSSTPETLVTPSTTPTPNNPAAKQNKTSPTPTLTSIPTPTPTAVKPTLVIKTLSLSSSSYSVSIGQTALLMVKATYSDGASGNVGSQVSWNQTPEIGTIRSPGFYTGALAGTTTISASLSGATSNEITITVGEQSKTLSRISVSCVKSAAQSQTFYSLPTAQCSASGYYSDGSSADVSGQVSWSVSGSAGGSISSSGLYTPRSQGSATITANLANTNGSTTLNIP